jgi:hypothetical protein
MLGTLKFNVVLMSGKISWERSQKRKENLAWTGKAI